MGYLFATKQFGVHEDGIHFLRNRFPFATLAKSEINKVVLKNGMQLANWPLIFLLGVCLVVPGFYMFYHIKESFAINDAFGLGARLVYYGAIPLVGIYFIYESLQYGPVLEIHYAGNKVKCFHLDKTYRKSLNEFRLLMKENFGSKFIDKL